MLNSRQFFELKDESTGSHVHYKITDLCYSKYVIIMDKAFTYKRSIGTTLSRIIVDSSNFPSHPYKRKRRLVESKEVALSASHLRGVYLNARCAS